MLRKSIPGDEKYFLKIKDQLPIKMTDNSTTTGGFLLGTDEATYLEYINTAYCLTALKGEEVVGFGIIFPDAILRASEVWEKRNDAELFIDLKEYEQQTLSYFEQLAFLPGHRRLVIKLAYQLAKMAFDAGAESLMTTTVNKPVLNLAAVPFIKLANGIHVGNIDEVYPLIGAINSDIWLIDKEEFHQKSQAHRLILWLRASKIENPLTLHKAK